MFRKFTGIVFLLLMSLHTLPAHAKSGATIYTSERVANARKNIAAYSWAASERDEITAYAARWLQMSDEQIWSLPVEQTVPRSMYVHETAGCPIHGKALVDQYGVYGWRVDPVNKPWKVQCPIGGETWPTNDFARFYQSGKDAANIFQTSIANRSHLYSTDPSRGYGVDDGRGYVDASGNRFNFIAYYNHWGVWQNVGRSWSQALKNLSEAYVLTGDPAYAHKTAILLSRIADLLPTMDTNTWSSQGYKQGDGLSGMGLVLGSLWDSVLASSITRAYDAIYPALQNDGALYTFLQAKASRHGLAAVDTPANYTKHIENHALVVLLNAIKQRRVRANEGIHQRAFAEAAIALDDPGTTPGWLQWLNLEGTPYEGGGHLPAIFVDAISRDGGSDEGSPGYNAIWLEALQPLADLLEDSPYAGDFSLTRYPNFRNFLSLPFWLQVTPNYYPHIGDEGNTGNPGIAPGTDPNRYAAAFHRYGFPELAQMAFALNGNSSAGLHGDIYDPGANETAQKIDDILATYGPPATGSITLTGYGLATLSETAGGRESAAWLYSGTMGKHGHRDRLNLGLFAYGLDLMPDLGYPDFPTVDSPNYWGWQNNTVAHNTVVVDAKRQQISSAGDSRMFLSEGPVKVVESDGNGVYAEAQTYLRTLIRVPTESGFYLLDIFRVRGGADHLYSLHAGPGAVETVGLTLAGQGGTYAGPNVSFGQFYDGACCATYMGSGFQFLDNVVNDGAPPAQYQAEWSVRDQWNVLPAPQDTRVRIWAAGDRPTRVSMADGHPPANKPGNPSTIRYLLERRTGTAPLTSSFVHVIEPSVGPSTILNVETFTPSPATDSAGFPTIGLRIVGANGRVDTIIHSLTAGSLQGDQIQLEGRGTVVSRTNGKITLGYLLSGTKLMVDGVERATGNGIWSGRLTRIESSDLDSIKLYVDSTPPSGGWIGRHLKVLHAGGHDPFYEIKGVETTNTGAIIDLGRVNLVRGHVDSKNYAKGFANDAAAGDGFEVQSDSYFPPRLNRNREEFTENENEATGKAPTSLRKAAGCAVKTEADATGLLPALLLFTVLFLRPKGSTWMQQRTKRGPLMPFEKKAPIGSHGEPPNGDTPCQRK